MLKTVDYSNFEWILVVAKSRVDSFSNGILEARIAKLIEEGAQFIAIDLRTTRFLSLAAIRYLVTIGHQLAERGGYLGLVGPSDKTKRHFEIYGQIDHMILIPPVHQMKVSREVDLVADRESSDGVSL